MYYPMDLPLDAECDRLCCDATKKTDIKDLCVTHLSGNPPEWFREAIYVSTNHVECLKKFLEWGLNPNYMFSKKISVEYGNEVCFHRLTCLATSNKNMECLQALVKKGADLAEPDSTLMTPLAIACELGSLKFVQYLIENGAPVREPKFSVNIHPLRVCSIKTQEGFKCMEYLLEKGADPKKKTMQGETLLHLVVKEYYSNKKLVEQAVRLLIKHGADILAEDYDGNKPTDYCDELKSVMIECSGVTIIEASPVTDDEEDC